MARYHYRARNKQGEIITGLVDAPTIEAAEKTVRDNGLVVLGIETPKSWREFLLSNRVKLKQRAFLTRQMSTMVNAGLPLPQVLSMLGRGEKNPVLKRTIDQVKDDLETGYSFSTAISKHPQVFSRVFVNAVRAGEATGKLEVVLKQLADTIERDNAASSSFRSMMIYPIFIIFAMLVVGGIMMVKVIPVLVNVFTESKAELPWATRGLIAIAHFVTGYWWLIIILVVALIFGWRAYIQTAPGRRLFDSAKLRIYVIKDMTKMFLMARFTRTMSMLVGAGVPLLEAIQITADAMDNILYKEALEHAAIQVERGVALSVSLSQMSLFPSLVSQMVLVGEQTGELDKVLNKLSGSYEEEYETAMKGATSLVEPLVIILLGLGVAFLVFAILIPIYQVSLLQS